MSKDLLCMLLFLCLNQFHKNFKARHQQHHIKIKRGKKEGITTLIRYKDMEIHIDVPKYFIKIKELLKYCSSIISIGVTPCKKQQRSTKEDADDRWCIQHVWRLMWKPRSINLFIGHFLILRLEEGNCNTYLLTSWSIKKLLPVFFIIEFSFSFPWNVSAKEWPGQRFQKEILVLEYAETTYWKATENRSLACHPTTIYEARPKILKIIQRSIVKSENHMFQTNIKLTLCQFSPVNCKTVLLNLLFPVWTSFNILGM